MVFDKVIVLGSGNVATHLSKALCKAGCNIMQVYSRQIENAKELAELVDAQAISKVKEISPEADLYLLCLSDSVIGDMVGQLDFTPSMIAHTAGSVPMTILKQFPQHGVFYPLQSFSKQREINMAEVPFCIEANSEQVKDKLWQLAGTISSNVRELSSEQRKQCHVAGVLVNNFVNHLYGLGADILSDKDISFEILKPIIMETAQKVQELNPYKVQTGPAKRKNTAVIEEHIEMMKAYGLDDLYEVLSDSIIEKNKE